MNEEVSIDILPALAVVYSQESGMNPSPQNIQFVEITIKAFLNRKIDYTVAASLFSQSVASSH